MNILDRVLKLREEKGWSEYRLSVESGVPQSTISSWYRKDAQPSLTSLKAICDACGITISELFCEEEEGCIYPTEIEKRLLYEFKSLENAQQQKLIEFLESFKK